MPTGDFMLDFVFWVGAVPLGAVVVALCASAVVSIARAILKGTP